MRKALKSPRDVDKEGKATPIPPALPLPTQPALLRNKGEQTEWELSLLGGRELTFPLSFSSRPPPLLPFSRLPQWVPQNTGLKPPSGQAIPPCFMETEDRIPFPGCLSLPREALLSARSSPVLPEQAGNKSWRLVKAGRCPLHNLSFLASFWFSRLVFLAKPVDLSQQTLLEAFPDSRTLQPPLLHCSSSVFPPGVGLFVLVPTASSHSPSPCYLLPSVPLHLDSQIRLFSSLPLSSRWIAKVGDDMGRIPHFILYA